MSAAAVSTNASAPLARYSIAAKITTIPHAPFAKVTSRAEVPDRGEVIAEHMTCLPRGGAAANGCNKHIIASAAAFELRAARKSYT